jgi:hypothetical protein
MKLKTVFLSIVLVLLSTNAFAQKQDAAAIVQSFYKFHLSRSGVFDAGEVKARQKWFSTDLNKLFQTELQREKEYLKANPTDKPHFGDGFPFQPYEECSKDGKSYKNTYNIGARTVEKDKATVEVKFYMPKECGGDLIETYKVELLKSKSNWLINNWLYADGTTLSQDLKRTDY